MFNKYMNLANKHLLSSNLEPSFLLFVFDTYLFII